MNDYVFNVINVDQTAGRVDGLKRLLYSFS